MASISACGRRRSGVRQAAQCGAPLSKVLAGGRRSPKDVQTSISNAPRCGASATAGRLETTERTIAASLATSDSARDYFLGALGRRRCRKRTPGPPPFSSMNSTPAVSRARRTAKSLAAVIDVWSSASSARRMVATPTADSLARSSARHRRNARAALIWPLVRGFGFILTAQILYDIVHIVQYSDDHRIAHIADAIFRTRGSHETGRVDKTLRRSLLIHWRLGCPDYHGR